jgi:hypothetical protein
VNEFTSWFCRFLQIICQDSGSDYVMTCSFHIPSYSSSYCRRCGDSDRNLRTLNMNATRSSETSGFTHHAAVSHPTRLDSPDRT